MSDIISPEQQKQIDYIEAALDARFKTLTVALDEKYTVKARGFRAWIETKDPLWVARRFGTAGVIVGSLFVYGVLHLMGKV